MPAPLSSLSVSPPCQMDVERFASGPQHLKYRKMLIEMIQDARTILINPLCRDILSRIRDQSREEFKAESNNGFVWYHSSKQYIDLGNWRYAFLFEFLVHFADYDHPILALGNHYPSLQAHHEFSLKSMELRADVIECLLAGCRETGACVPEDVKTMRVELHMKVKQFLKKADALTRWLVDFNMHAVWLNPSIVYSAAMHSLDIVD